MCQLLDFFSFGLASVRVMGIVMALLDLQYRIHFVTTSKKDKEEMSDLKEYLGIRTDSVNPNNLPEMEKLLKSSKVKPHIAIFDTFVAEEMFR